MQTAKPQNDLFADERAVPSSTPMATQFTIRHLFIAAAIVAAPSAIILWLRLNSLQASAFVFVLMTLLALIAANAWLGPWRSLVRSYGVTQRPAGRRFNYVSGVIGERFFVFHLFSLACCVSDAGLSLTKMVWLPRPLQQNILIPWKDLAVYKQPRGSAAFMTGTVHIVLHGRRVTEAIGHYVQI